MIYIYILLTFAIIKNRINIVEYLLKYENSLNLNKIDCKGFTPFENTINQNNKTVYIWF